MNTDWQELIRMANGDKIIINKVSFKKSGISVEGSFELPSFAGLSADDQVFVSAFLQCHGSIKQMESLFGISYPTVKNRLNRIAGKNDFVESDHSGKKSDVLSKLDSGEITVDEAIKALKKNGND